LPASQEGIEARRAALRRERHGVALGETSGRSPLTGIELGRWRSREVRRLEQVVGGAVVLHVYDARSGRAPPRPDANYRRRDRTARSQ
jgi:hypothetical protein